MSVTTLIWCAYEQLQQRIRLLGDVSVQTLTFWYEMMVVPNMTVIKHLISDGSNSHLHSYLVHKMDTIVNRQVCIVPQFCCIAGYPFLTAAVVQLDHTNSSISGDALKIAPWKNNIDKFDNLMETHNTRQMSLSEFISELDTWNFPQETGCVTLIDLFVCLLHFLGLCCYLFGVLNQYDIANGTQMVSMCGSLKLYLCVTNWTSGTLVRSLKRQDRPYYAKIR